MLYMKAKNADSCNQCVIAQALSAVAYAGFCLRAGGGGVTIRQWRRKFRNNSASQGISGGIRAPFSEGGSSF